MLTEYTVLKYFYKQNRQLTLKELFEKFDTNDRILVPINSLVDKDWLEECENDPTCWRITDEGKEEHELREKLRKQSSNTINNNIGNNYGQANLSGHGSLLENRDNNPPNKTPNKNTTNVDQIEELSIIDNISKFISNPIMKFFLAIITGLIIAYIVFINRWN